MAKKKMLSRRRRALRSLALLVCILGVLYWGNFYNFTPDQALNDWKRSLGLREEKFETVKTISLDGENGTSRQFIRLSASENEMMTTEMYFDLLQGWYVRGTTHVEWEEDKTLQIYAWQEGNSEDLSAWLWGCAEGGTESLDLRVHCACWYGYGDEEPLDLFLTVTDFTQWDDRQMFLLQVEDILPTYSIREVYRVTETGEEFLCYAGYGSR